MFFFQDKKSSSTELAHIVRRGISKQIRRAFFMNLVETFFEMCTQQLALRYLVIALAFDGARGRPARIRVGPAF
jgi:hypothetical protein